MYTVLIVDDEPLVQVGLQSMIDWPALGFRLLPSASNGKVAWEAIVRDNPDLVITDIKMPLMDGLELIRKCRQEHHPCPHFLVLTSHEDFAYAREAVKHQVADYLIKLELTPEVLTEAVLRVRAASPRAGTALPEDRAPWRLLEPGYPDEAAATEAWKAPWTGLGAVATCRLDKGDSESQVYAGRMIQEILSREYGVKPLRQGPDRLVLVLTAVAGLEAAAVETRLAASLATALAMAQRYFNGALTAGLGPVVRALTGLPESYRGSLAALDSGGPDLVTVYTHLGAPPAPLLTGEEFRTRLEQALGALDENAVTRCFQEARASILAHGRLTDALDLGTAALYAVLSIPQGEALVAELFAGHPDGYKHLYAVPNTTHVLVWLETLETGLRSHLEGLGSRHQEKLVEAMKRFIESHYRERLQLKAVAEHFRLSPNYAGTLFRQFAGQGFSEYVSETKVAKARDLLASRKYRVYEISELLGFENTYYFSKVFRRVTGRSPREFLAEQGHLEPDPE